MKSPAVHKYEAALSRAAAAFNFTVGQAADLFGHGSVQHCAAIDTARLAHGRDVEAARIEFERAGHRLIVVGDHRSRRFNR